MVGVNRFVALTIFLGVLQCCICTPIAADTNATTEEKDVAKIFTADELQRARSVGIRDRELMNGISRGVTVDEMIKLFTLQKSEAVRYEEDFNETIPLTFEEMTKICEIFVPDHKTATNYSKTQQDRLNQLWTALDDFPRKIQFLFMRNSLCAYASEPSQLDKRAETFGSNFVPYMRFRFWILKSKNSTTVDERVNAVKQQCCAYKGEYNKEITEIKVEPTGRTLSKEQITNFDKVWKDFESANTSKSFDKVCDFLRTTNPSDKC